MKRISIFMLSTLASLTYANQIKNPIDLNNQNTQLVQMTDDELANTQGQALMNITRTNDANQGLSFYRLGMEAEIAINANIKKLQLGCGGSKGEGCDIDIDNVALTGITTSDAQAAGVNTDFKLTNPFVEFAITDADKASTRSITGFRLGALKALGMMSLGSNSDTLSLSDDTGINSLSGDIGARVTNATIKDLNISVLGANLLTADAKVDNYSTTLIANRDTKFSLTGLRAVATLNLFWPFNSIPLTLTNANVLDIPYKTVHRLQVSDLNGNPTSGAYLSLQSRDISWQNIDTKQWNAVSAKKGWWLSIPDTQFKDLNIDGSGTSISVTAAIGGIVFGAPVNLPALDLGQKPVNNCYGALKFC